MKTWRWDLFYEIDHMETIADERTARLEARRNRMLVRIWPWMMLIAWFAADAFCGGRIAIMFMLTIYIPVLGNNLLALKEGTFCTDDDKLDERSVRTNAKVELLVRPPCAALVVFRDPIQAVDAPAQTPLGTCPCSGLHLCVLGAGGYGSRPLSVGCPRGRRGDPAALTPRKADRSGVDPEPCSECGTHRDGPDKCDVRHMGAAQHKPYLMILADAKGNKKRIK